MFLQFFVLIAKYFQNYYNHFLVTKHLSSPKSPTFIPNWDNIPLEKIEITRAQPALKPHHANQQNQISFSFSLSHLYTICLPSYDICLCCAREEQAKRRPCDEWGMSANLSFTMVGKVEQEGGGGGRDTLLLTNLVKSVKCGSSWWRDGVGSVIKTAAAAAAKMIAQLPLNGSLFYQSADVWCNIIVVFWHVLMVWGVIFTEYYF